MIPSCLFAPWVVPVLGGPGAVGLPSGALPHGLRPVSAPARLSQGKGIIGSILGLISWLWGNDFVTKQTSSIWACRCQSCQMGTLEEISLSCYNNVVSQDYEARVRIFSGSQYWSWYSYRGWWWCFCAVNGDSDYVGMVMIMFHNTCDYQWDGNDNVPEYWWLSILWLGAVCAGGLWLHSSRANLNIFIFCNR